MAKEDFRLLAVCVDVKLKEDRIVGWTSRYNLSDGETGV